MATSDVVNGCGCPCCHCACCCKHVRLTFKAGCPKTADFPQGCDCAEPPAELRNEFQYPDFEPIYGLSETTCCVPCGDLMVSVSSTCCLKCSGNAITAVGPGTVSASLSGTNDCGPYTVMVNGSVGSVRVNDGDGVSITLQPTNGECCSVVTKCEGGTYPNCDSLSVYRKYIYKNGKIVLNPEYLKDQLNLRRQINSGGMKPTNRNIKAKNRMIKRKLF